MASSNLFKELYSRDNSIQNSGFVCSNARNESETSFDISGNAGTITDSNGNILATIPLDAIHAADISQYNVETRILQPYSCYVLQGQEYGLAKTTYYYQIPTLFTDESEYPQYLGVEFDIIYNQHCHEHRHIEIPVSGVDFTQALNDYFDSYEINVTSMIQRLKCPNDPSKTDEYLVIQAQEDGYFFFIKNVRLLVGVMSEDFPDSPFSNEVEDIKFSIVSAIQEYHPVKIGQEYNEDTYEVDCKLYTWLLENYNEAIVSLTEYQQALNILSVTDRDLTDEDFENANNLIKDTVYNNSIFEHYDIEEQKQIANIVEALKGIIELAAQKYPEHYWLQETDCWRIPVMKYPNGAFRGIVIVPDYPDDSEYEFSTLYINHVQTMVNAYIPDHHGCYKKMEMGVMSNAMFKQEAELCSSNPHNGSHIKFQSNKQLKTDIEDGWDNALDNPGDLWTAPDWDHENENHTGSFDFEYHKQHKDDIIYLGESCYSDKTKIMGIYRYMDYVNDNHLWMKIGDAYMAIGKADNHQSNIKNLLTSVMIYNPNSIPIRIQYLIFS